MIFDAVPKFRNGSDLNIYISNWPTPAYFSADTVSAVLMHDSVLNEYILDAVTHSGTDWVVTFPTKRFYVETGTGPAEKLFQRNFNNAAGSCDDVTLNIYDREEQTTSSPTTVLAAAADADQLDLLGSEYHHVQQQQRPWIAELSQHQHRLPARVAEPGVRAADLSGDLSHAG